MSAFANSRHSPTSPITTSALRCSRNDQRPDFVASGRQDDGLAGRLRVEEPVGFLGLL